MKAIILAAGYATRLYPLTKNFPKALLPIADKPIINYLLDELETLPELNQVHVVSNHRFIGHFENWLNELNQAKRYERLHIQVWDDGTSNDETKLGAVGDSQFVIDQAKLDDELLVAAADNFFTFPLIQFYNDFKSHQCDTLCAARMTDLNSLRRMAVATLDENRKVLNLEEKPEQPKSDIAVYALYLYRREKELDEYERLLFNEDEYEEDDEDDYSDDAVYQTIQPEAPASEDEADGQI